MRFILKRKTLNELLWVTFAMEHDRQVVFYIAG